MSRAIAGGRPAARPSPSRVLVLLAAVAALLVSGCSYQTAGAPKGDLTLTATFADGRQLAAGHSVQTADVRVGSGTRGELVGHKGRATLSTEDGAKIPQRTKAETKGTSRRGENYVELRLPPGRS